VTRALQVLQLQLSPTPPSSLLVSEMTYNVLMGTLNPTHSLTLILSSNTVHNGDILVPANSGPPRKWPREKDNTSCATQMHTN